ncbi:MAG: hypothetical protein ACRYFA_08445 [Janthinobacterium lividum]
MKSYTTSINKMMKNFDKELKTILEKDIATAKTAHNGLIKNIDALPDIQLKIA